MIHLNSKFEQQFYPGCLVRVKRETDLFECSYWHAEETQKFGRGDMHELVEGFIVVAFDYDIRRLDWVDVLIDIKVMRNNRFWYATELTLTTKLMDRANMEKTIEDNKEELKNIVDDIFEVIG